MHRPETSFSCLKSSRRATTVIAALLICGALRGEEPAPALPQFHEGKAGAIEKLPLPPVEPFKTQDGRTGWKLRIPGDRPLATPAVVGGVLYVGGGFGSHEFYALNARTGEQVWGFRTGDDGPTAAVVAEDCVAYNTESCTLYVHDAKTGRVLWHRWLGDPLMSQPVIGGGRICMAYPGQGGHHIVAFELKTGKVLWDRPIAAEIISAPVLDGDSIYAATCEGTLYRFDAATGRPHWSKACNATCAPIVVDGKPYFSQRMVKDVETTVGEGAAARKVTTQTVLEGFNRADAKTGELALATPCNAIEGGFLFGSADGHVNYATNNAFQMETNSSMRGGSRRMSQALSQTPASGGGVAPPELAKQLDDYANRPVAKDADGGLADAKQAEALAGKLLALAPSLPAAKQAEVAAGAAQLRQQAEAAAQAARAAKDALTNSAFAAHEEAAGHAHDAAVGFAAAPAAANVMAAKGNIGQAGVKAIWAYQGSRPCWTGRECVTIAGATMRGTDLGGERVLWERKLESKASIRRPASPPAHAGGRIYYGTADGLLVCADPATGKTLWEANVGGNILFQPAVVGGRVYAATNEGMLICLETGDAKADGWTMWGGSATHNGPQK